MYEDVTSLSTVGCLHCICAVCVRDTGARATGGQCKNNIYICVNYISEKVTKKLTLSVNELIM